MTTFLDELEAAVAAVTERVGPSVVGLGRGWGRGSGVVIAEGRVLTNAHVLRGEEVAIARAGAGGGDVAGRGGDAGTGAGGGDVVAGRVVGFDADLDVAV